MSTLLAQCIMPFQRCCSLDRITRQKENPNTVKLACPLFRNFATLAMMQK